MPLCRFGGYCTRVRGHTGTHTALPFPSTKRFDRRIEDAVTLVMLDFPAPPWADLLDDHA
jgi:hypothetical protein